MLLWREEGSTYAYKLYTNIFIPGERHEKVLGLSICIYSIKHIGSPSPKHQPEILECSATVSNLRHSSVGERSFLSELRFGQKTIRHSAWPLASILATELFGCVAFQQHSCVAFQQHCNASATSS